MNDPQESKLDQQLHLALGTASPPNFDRWQSEHVDAIAYLNPVVTEFSRRKRKRLIRIANVIVAATVLVAALTWVFSAPANSFAETVAGIDNAKSATWTRTIYERIYSKDGQRTWIRKRRAEFAYKHPGLYRLSKYDHRGQLIRVDIADTVNEKRMTLDMRKKNYKHETPGFQASFDPGGAFGWVKEVLDSRPIELIGKRIVEGRQASVVRFRRPAMRGDIRDSVDLWIDLKTKELIGLSDPGANAFDVETLDDRDNPAEDEVSKGTMLGSITGNIVFDADVDASLFDLTPPEGFEEAAERPRVKITEAELAQWYRIVARVNDDTFADSSRASDTERIWTALRKEPADRNALETELGEMWLKNLINGNATPTWAFQEQQTIEGTFRYVGKGVKLGDGKRMVCWYKLKSTGKYRAIFGDLTIRDTSEEELPLPVD